MSTRINFNAYDFTVNKIDLDITTIRSSTCAVSDRQIAAAFSIIRTCNTVIISIDNRAFHIACMISYDEIISNIVGRHICEEYGITLGIYIQSRIVAVCTGLR